MGPSAHASRPMAGQRKPTGAKPPSGPPTGGLSSCSSLSLLASVPCVTSSPLLLTVRRASRVILPHTREKGCVRCFPAMLFFFLRAQPPPRFTGSSKVAAPFGDQEKCHLGFPYFVVRVSDEDRKHVHRNGAAVPAALAFFRLFVEASYLAAPPARVKDAPLDVFFSLFSFFFFPCCTCSTH